MTSFRRVSYALATTLMIVSAAGTFAQQAADKVFVSILKGPSGIGSAWMMAAPPSSPGVDLQFVTAASADLVTAKLVSGEIQGGVLPVNVAAKLFNAGVPIRAIAVVGNGMVKFLSNDSSIRRFSDLKGKEIYIAGQKATPDYLFRFLAEKENMKAGKDFTPLYNLASPEVAAQLAAGKVSCAVLPEPFATQALLLNGNIVSPLNLDALWTERTGLESYPMSLFVLSRRFIESRPELVRVIAEAYKASIEKTLADPAATGQLVETLGLGMKAAIAEAAIPKSAYVYIDASEARASIETLLSLFLVSDPLSVGGKLPTADFYSR
ncbi:MAG TPA: ABC transporter substrate-binding protein [Rectinemataceae bacterium]|nr:ABC transporter substrate-binding protein [Rectinemataceae bacterium]